MRFYDSIIKEKEAANNCALYRADSALETIERDNDRLYYTSIKIRHVIAGSDEVISDALLIAMILKGLTSDCDIFANVITQREKQITFAEFRGALRSREESAKAHGKETNKGNNVMMTKPRFDGNCFKCGRKRHKRKECRSKTSEKWCSNCRSKTHETKNCRKKEDAAKKATGETTWNDDEHTFAFVFKDTNKKSRIDNRNSSLLVDINDKLWTLIRNSTLVRMS